MSAHVAPLMPPLLKTAKRGPGLVVSLVVIAVVAGWDMVGVFIPSFMARDLEPLPWIAFFTLTLSAYVAYAIGLAIVARTNRRRLLALVPVAVAGGIVVAMMLAFEQFDTGVHELLFDISDITDYLIPVLVVAAWGIARRTGWWWPIGLLVTAALIWARYPQSVHREFSALQYEMLSWFDSPYAGFQQDFFAVTDWAAFWLLPLLAGGLVGWLLDAVLPAQR